MTAIPGETELQFAGDSDQAPWFAELRPCPAPSQIFQRLSQRPYCLFLDSAAKVAELGRYSFLMCDPFERHEVHPDQSDPFDPLRKVLAKWRADTHRDLPPFQGGLAGLWSFDLNRSFEAIPKPKVRDVEVPALALGLYDTVIAWDHQQDRAWIISQGFPETDLLARCERAHARILQYRDWITTHALEDDPTDTRRNSGFVSDTETWVNRARTALDELAPSYPVEGYANVRSNFQRSEFLKLIARGVEYIRAGDIFQVNLAHRLLSSATCAPQELYLALRVKNPAPFAGYLNLGHSQIISASPERLIRLRDRCVESRPIKGTTYRTQFPEADLQAAQALRLSEKDRAENVMIVDLLRNDLSRVCESDSICVTQLCEVESYQYVQHLVSAIQGTLKAESSPLDMIQAIFPGGSITGAPKIRAMEIIAELEPTPRGAYCGSLGYIGFDGTTDLNILIRTITAQQGWWTFPVGGGIVYQSSPESELAETWHKARGLLQAIQAVARK